MLGLIHRRASAKADDLDRLADLLRGARRSIASADSRESGGARRPPSRRRA
jgi:hypothetical protein